MGRSGFDKVAIFGVYLAAIVQATQAALSSAPAVQLRFPALDITGGVWAYVPFALITVSSAAWLLERLLPDRGSYDELKSYNELTRTLTESTARLVARQPAPPDPSAPKSFVPENFVRRYIDAIDQQRTDLQIDALLRPHLNQWMIIEGKVERTTVRIDSIGVMLSNPNATLGHIFFAKFHLSWSTHLANVDAGEVIRISAQIIDTGYGIELMNAELL